MGGFRVPWSLCSLTGLGVDGFGGFAGFCVLSLFADILLISFYFSNGPAYAGLFFYLYYSKN